MSTPFDPGSIFDPHTLPETPPRPGSKFVPLFPPDTPPTAPAEKTPPRPGSKLMPLVLPDTPPPAPAELVPETPPASAEQTPPRQGSKSNPFSLPDTPPPPPPPPAAKPRARGIFGGPKSTILPHVRAEYQATFQDLETVRARIRALESTDAQNRPPPAAAPSTSSARASGSGTSSTSSPSWTSSGRERGVGTRAILALEASLMEGRRSRAGPASAIPRGSGVGAASERAARREVAQQGRLTGVAGPTATQPLGGYRVARGTALKHRDLWLRGVGPREQVAHPDKEHTKCGICHMVKSHPVSYLCGHSHCYVCIRLWLERSWTCPECVAPMYRPPFRQYSEEATIASEYPDWRDRSRVDYSFKGLSFPLEPLEI